MVYFMYYENKKIRIYKADFYHNMRYYAITERSMGGS